jgi:predicted MFS family arabinose efflux permease
MAPSVESRWARLSRTPRDVQIVCAYSFLFHAGWCAWERSVLPVWITTTSGSRELVGFVQSAQGALAVVAAPLIGYGMDHATSLWPYQYLTVGSCLGALLGMAYCVRASATGVPLYAASVLWALALTGQGILMDTAIAQGTRPGEERAWGFALKSACWRAGAFGGQLLNALVFATLGDAWTPRATAAAIYVGLALCLSTVLLLLLDLEERDEPEPVESAREHLVDKRPTTAADDAPEPAPSGPCGLRALAPQWIIFYSVIIRVLGKGMVMRFNPLLLTERFGLSPLGLTSVTALAQLISIGSPLGLGYVATRVGGAQTMVAARLLEPAAFVMLALADSTALASAAFVVLLGVPQGAKSIEKATLMDHVHKRTRSRWNALESLNRGTWAGSAALGGVLLERLGYTPLYLAAAAVILLSVAVLSALIGRQPRAIGSEANARMRT